MFRLDTKKIINYTDFHYNFLKKVYEAHNFKEDTKEGNNTFLAFISTSQAKARMEKGSLFYEAIIGQTTVGIYEIEDNHLTLLYIDHNFHKQGIGTYCIKTIATLLQGKSKELTVCASPYSLDFYVKNNFVRKSEDLKMVRGMAYYLMALKIGT